jgi:hypothetical protein
VEERIYSSVMEVSDNVHRLQEARKSAERAAAAGRT